MFETTVTLQGWLGGNVTTRVVGDALVASFRVASTPRRFQRSTETWVDGDTQWYTVTAWRALAENCQQSLRRSDPVVVHGRLTVRTWVGRDGVEHTTLEIEATHVGHDLSRGPPCSRVRRSRSPPPPPPMRRQPQVRRLDLPSRADSSTVMLLGPRLTRP